MSSPTTTRPGRTVWVTLLVLILIILGSAGVRVVFDWPEILAGTLPSEDAFEFRYVQYPILAYLHIVPGVVYIVGAPFQLSRRFRERHFTLHRRMGRALLAFGLTSGILGIVVGIVLPYGGLLETSASVVFGAYFVTALVVAFWLSFPLHALAAEFYLSRRPGADGDARPAVLG